MGNRKRAIVHWLRENEIFLAIRKREIVLLITQKTIIKKNMNFRIHGQKMGW